MCRAVGSDDARTVHRDGHVEVLQAHVVYDLIKGTLQECRIYCRNRFQSLARHPSTERDRVLFRYTNVEGSVWEFF